MNRRNVLRSGIAALCLALATACSNTESPTAPNDAPDSAVAARVVQLVNQYRQQNGLPALVDSSPIDGVAYQHSQEMAGGAVPIGHTGFPQRQAAICAQLPCSFVSENVAFASCQSQPADAMAKGFFDSPEHREAILGNWDRTGIGVASVVQGGCRAYYCTQIFFQPR